LTQAGIAARAASAYDTDDRLSSVTDSNGNVTTNAYDTQGRRKSKSVNGTTTIYVTDADNREVLEYNGSTGAIGNWYAYALGPNDALNQMNVASGTRATLIPDIQGSFIGALDASSGTLTKYGYQTYGESNSPNTSFAYTGQRVDPETGLYYYRARMYSTAWGRFPQTDPIGYRGGSNLYAYVNNDPLNLVDTLGLAADSPEATSGWVASAQTWLQSAASNLSSAISSAMMPLGMIPRDIQNMTTDLLTNPAEFLRAAGPTFAGLGMSIPLAGAAASSGETSASSIISSIAQQQANLGVTGLSEYMSVNQLNAYLANPAAGSRFVGTAVHDATADVLVALYPGRFVYNAVGPDFLDTTTGEMIELTTPRQVATHFARPGYGGVTMSTYTFPAGP